jgi:mannose-6-phosphate isomerase-like protein (cupin superfamily)
MTTKYGKYIFTEPSPPMIPGEPPRTPPDRKRPPKVMRIDASMMDGIGIEFSFVGQSEPSADKHPTHTHDVDEYLFMMGGEELYDFGAEVELTLGAGKDREKHIITKSSIVYIPAGLPHLPWSFKKVTKPIIRGHILVASNYRQQLL